MGAFRAATLAALIAAAAAIAAPHHARAMGIPAAQSDSACAAHVPGRTDPNDYVKGCADLITQLKDVLAKCDAVAKLPDSAKANADPQDACHPENLSRVGDQLAAAYNDRAYFLIQCKGTENYRRAVEDLDNALKLLPDYWVAIRNRAIAYMLLGQHKEAREDFQRLITAIGSEAERRKAGGPASQGTGTVLIRPTAEAEVGLGIGFASLGLCEVQPAQDAFVATERLSLAPIGSDPWIRAAALFGQGLTLKLKGSAQERIAATNNAITAAEKGRLQRYAADLKSQGEAKMQAARALVRTIDADVKDRFYIEEGVVITKCRDNKLSA